MSQFRPTSKAAFTLIELLVVIAIIGILTALMFPVVGRIRKQAMLAKDVSNLKQIAVATQMYATDHNAHYPTLKGPVGPSDTSWVGPFWTDQLTPYLDAEKKEDVKVFKVASMDSSHAIGGYGANDFIFNLFYEKPVALARVKHPATTIMVCTTAKEVKYETTGVLQGVFFFSGLTFQTDPWSKKDQPLPFPGHHGKVVIAFCDGHVAAMTRTDLAEKAKEYVGENPRIPNP